MTIRWVTKPMAKPTTKYYVIRLNNPLRWAYIKSTKGWKQTFVWADKQFGSSLVAFEPAPVKRVKDKREIFTENIGC